MPWISTQEQIAGETLFRILTREGIGTAPRELPYTLLNLPRFLQLFLRLSSFSYSDIAIPESRTLHVWIDGHLPDLDLFSVNPDNGNLEATPDHFLNNWETILLNQNNVQFFGLYNTINELAAQNEGVRVDWVGRWQEFINDTEDYAERCFGGPREVNMPAATPNEGTVPLPAADPADDILNVFAQRWNVQATDTGIRMPEEQIPQARPDAQTGNERGWRRRERERREPNRAEDLTLWYSECFVRYKDRVCYVRDFYSDEPGGNTNISVRIHKISDLGVLEERHLRVAFKEELFDVRRPPIGWAIYKRLDNYLVAEFYRYTLGSYRRGISGRNLNARVMITPDGTGRAPGMLHAQAARALFTQSYIPLEQGLASDDPIFLVNPVIAVFKPKQGTKRLFFNDVSVATVGELKTKTIIKLDNKYKSLSKVISRMTNHEAK